MTILRSLLLAGLLALLLAGTVHAQWIQTNGPYGGDVNCFAVSGTNLFAGTYGGGVFRRPLSDMITSVEQSGSMPSHFTLEQNYPNPFNPSTNIQFALSQSSFVALEVFNALGERIDVLVSKELNTGSYEVNFNSRGLTSGVYFYKMQVIDPNRVRTGIC